MEGVQEPLEVEKVENPPQVKKVRERRCQLKV